MQNYVKQMHTLIVTWFTGFHKVKYKGSDTIGGGIKHVILVSQQN